MKKKIAAWAIGAFAALGLAGGVWAAPAYAQETEMEGSEAEGSEGELHWEVSSGIEEGVLTIQIKSSEYEKEDSWWQNRIFEGEDAPLVELAQMTETEGYAYIGSFRAVDGAEDGDDIIRLVYTNGDYVSEYMEWTVSVKDGAITEVIGGGQAFATTAEDLAPVFSGDWQEENGTKTMRISKTEADGLEVVITDKDGNDGEGVSYVMHAFYDAEKEALVYWDGAEYPADSANAPEEAMTEAEIEPEFAGRGMFSFLPASEDAQDEEDIAIVWQDDTFGNSASGKFLKAE